ncbi:MAG: hypothetical protein QW331_04580, partial [Candidatus Woesearchaeota archaeon]
IISPIKADLFVFLTSSFFMIISLILFVVFMESERKFSWKEGIAMILFYVLFIIVEMNLKGMI